MNFFNVTSSSVTLLRFKGIPINLHLSFIILSLLAAGYCLAVFGVKSTYSILIIFTMLFASTLLHELGHALMASRLGFSTKNITLYPFGGIALVSLNRDDHNADMLVSSAGPGANLIASIIATPVMIIGSEHAKMFILINMIMCVFNLIPALPLDGGRVLRAMLSKCIGFSKSNKIMMKISYVISCLFILFGLLFNLIGLTAAGAIMFFALKKTSFKI